MAVQTSRREAPHDADEPAVCILCQRWWDACNARDGHAFVAAFAEDGESIGFDGSELSGRTAIASSLRQIVADHPTPAYVGKVRAVRFLAGDVAHLQAVASMAPLEQSDLNPQLNAVQTLVTIRRAGEWRIAAFQNTPAQLHGGPKLVQQMTDEPRQLLQPGLSALILSCLLSPVSCLLSPVSFSQS